MKSGFPWRFSTPSPTVPERWSSSARCWRSISGSWAFPSPMGRAFWMLPPHPERKSWRTPMPGMPAAGRCGASWKRPPSPTPAPPSLSIPSTSPWGWFRWTGCGRLQNHTKQPSQSILPQFFSNAFWKTRRPAGFAIPSLWHWPFPSICAPGSPRKPCETLSLPCAPALTPH